MTYQPRTILPKTSEKPASLAAGSLRPASRMSVTVSLPWDSGTASNVPLTLLTARTQHNAIHIHVPLGSLEPLEPLVPVVPVVPVVPLACV